MRLLTRLTILRSSMLLILLLVSCTPSASVIEGTWTECPSNSLDESEALLPISYFEFYANGRFEGYEIPMEHFIDILPIRANVSGTWEIPESPEVFDVLRINLTFDQTEDLPFDFDSVLYLSTDSKIIFHGMGGDRILYMRSDVNCK
jgi:hypothetical protein